MIWCRSRAKYHRTVPRGHRTTLFMHGMLALAICFPCFAQSPESLLDYVMEQQEAALRSIHSSSYQLEYYSRVDGMREGKPSQQTTTRVLTRTVHGDNMRIDQLETVYNDIESVADQPPYLETRTYVAVNEEYAAFWRDGLTGGMNMRLQVHEYASPSSMLGTTKRTIRALEANLFDYAYGLGDTIIRLSSDGKTSIRDYRDDLPGQFSARKIIEDGQELYEVTYTRPGSQGWEIRAVVDPSMGFMTTKVNLNRQREDSDNYDLGEYTITPHLTDQGIWVPAELELARDKRSNPTSEYQRELLIQATSIEVNIDIDPIIFEWASLGYPGETGLRLDALGGTHRMRITGRGKWRAHELSPEAALERRKKWFLRDAIARAAKRVMEYNDAPDTEASAGPAQEGSSSASRWVGGLLSAGLLGLIVCAIILIRRGA